LVDKSGNNLDKAVSDGMASKELTRGKAARQQPSKMKLRTKPYTNLSLPTRAHVVNYSVLTDLPVTDSITFRSTM
jgi:hypothetical protein